MLVNGSLFNLVNMVKMDNWLFTIDNRLMVNLDPRLRHSGTSSAMLFGVYLLIRKRAVLRKTAAYWRFMLACWLT